MKALILAAGYGTRLEPLTLAVPKPMVPIVNLPTMQHNLELLKKYGFTDITANIHYHPEQIENYFGDGSGFGVNLTYSFEEELLGTAGGVKRMAEISHVDDAFVVLSSDALTDINLQQLVDFHNLKKALATVALKKVSKVSDFGVVIHNDNGLITGFQEKPKPEVALSEYVNTGIYVFEPEILKLIPDGFYDFGRQLFPHLVKDKAAFFGCQMDGYWSDVGCLLKYQEANSDALAGRVKIKLSGERKADNSLVGNHCVIGRNVKIKDSIIGDKCTIGDGTEISGSIIWSDTKIGKDASLEKAIVGSWCRLGAGVQIKANAVIANRCAIRKGEIVEAGKKLKPNTAT